MDEPSLETTRLEAFQELILRKFLPPFHFSSSMAQRCRQKHTLHFATILLVSFLNMIKHFRIPSENQLLVIIWKIHPSQLMVVVKIQKDHCSGLVERSICDSRFQRQWKLARALMWDDYHKNFH